jgi:hypothetical protein
MLLCDLDKPGSLSFSATMVAVPTCFFLSEDSGAVVFLTTPSLSQKTLVGPSKGTPIIRSLLRSPSIMSIAVRKALYSDPKVEDLTVFCHLENH